MNQEHWQKIKGLLDDALKLDAQKLAHQISRINFFSFSKLVASKINRLDRICIYNFVSSKQTQLIIQQLSYNQLKF